ncbi:ankyrin [Clavulina sp. PMI_390]|nr:ankyrin [Clavulina sp. PMI_390]
MTTLRAFINTKLNGEDFNDSDWLPSFKEGVISTLIDKSQSMFLWAQLQIETLKGCWQTEASLRLLDLPPDLAATYDRIFNSSVVQHRESFRIVVECIIAATARGRALFPAEVQEILRFDLIPALEKPTCLVVAATHQEARKHSPLAQTRFDIFKYLPRALFKLDEKDGSIGFIHFTVQEYLVSQPKSENDPRHQFGTSLLDARTAYFLVLMSTFESVNAPYVPNLMRYAEKSWYIHAKLALADNLSITNPLEHFLNPDSQSFNDWVERRYHDFDLEYYRESDTAHSHHDHPIHWAVRIGSLAQVKRLCQLDSENDTEPHSDIRNAYDSLNWTPLCWAAVCGNVEIFTFLLEGNTSWTHQHVGPFRNEYGNQGETTTVLDILLSAKGQLLHISRVDELKSARLAWPLDSFHLLYRLHAQSATMVQALLDTATNPLVIELLSARDVLGFTPLLQALERLRNQEEHPWLLDLVRVLLSKGANPHIQTKDGKGIAHIACKYNAWIIPALIAEIKIDVNLSDKNGDTPLHIVVEWSMESVEILLNAGADPNKRNSKGDGPLDIVLEKIADYQDAAPRSQEGYLLEGYKKKRELLERYGARLHSQARNKD